MTEDPKTLAIRALSNMKGDDTARARAAFRRFSPEDMNKEHGESGKTRAAILAEYEAHDAKIDAAIEWVKSK
jgi:hypothetical protein